MANEKEKKKLQKNLDAEITYAFHSDFNVCVCVCFF